MERGPGMVAAVTVRAGSRAVPLTAVHPFADDPALQERPPPLQPVLRASSNSRSRETFGYPRQAP